MKSFIEKLLKLIIVFLVIIGLIYMIKKIIQKENTYNGLMIMPMMMKVVKY
jgi:flagellar biogenesis protein FliO